MLTSHEHYKQSFVKFIEEIQARGHYREAARSIILSELITQSHMAEKILINEIIKSPMAGLAFIKSVNLMLGMTNEIVSKYEIEPFHIMELGLATPQTAVEFFKMDVDTLYKKYEEGSLF